MMMADCGPATRVLEDGAYFTRGVGRCVRTPLSQNPMTVNLKLISDEYDDGQMMIVVSWLREAPAVKVADLMGLPSSDTSTW